MHKWLVLAAVAMFAAVSVQGSTIEDETTKVHPALVYQEDFHVPGDATGTCETADSARVAHLGEEAHGTLVDLDDISDAVYTDNAEAVGERLVLSLVPGTKVAGFEVDFDVFTADCSRSIFAPAEAASAASAYSSQATAGDGEQIVLASGIVEHDCNDNQWKVMLKDKSGRGPTEVHMEWTDGSSATVPLRHASQGSVYKFVHDDNLDYSLASVSAVVPDDWNGWFKVAHGPCNLPDGEPRPSENAEKDGTYAEWDAVDESYVVVITLTKGVEEIAAENADEAVQLATDPPTSVNMNCHEFCTAIGSDVLYLLKFETLSAR